MSPPQQTQHPAAPAAPTSTPGKSTTRRSSAKPSKPAEPDFDVTWENFDKVKDCFNLTDAETTTTLLKILGPDPRGEEYWKKFMTAPKKLQPHVAPAPPTKNHPDIPDTQPDDDEEMDIFGDDLDGDELDDDDAGEVATTGHGSGKPDSPSPPGSSVSGLGSEDDQVETLTMPMDEGEPVIAPVPKPDDPAESAKRKLEEELRAQATPLSKGRSLQARFDGLICFCFLFSTNE